MSDVPPRILKETLRTQLAPEGAGCLDAGTVAAWFDGTLNARERAAAEAHASTCARCQALVAAIAVTAPAQTESPRWWQLSAVKWLVPLAGAAAAVVLWINVERRPVRPAQVASNAQPS